jgi:antitoxin VapB
MALKTEQSVAGRLHDAERANAPVRDPLVEALVERMRHKPRRDPADIRKALREIGERCAVLPVTGNRSADEILGYDEHGLPH